MKGMITKSDFIRYLECPEYSWFFKKKPEVLSDQGLSEFDKQLIKNGQEVELWARKLFPNGRLVTGREEEAVRQTDELLKEGVRNIFQATFQADGLYAMVDILEWDQEDEYWVINEVKGTSAKEKKKDQHLYDACFQYIVLSKAGYEVGRVNLIELNKDFRKQGEINPRELLATTDVTDKIKELETEVLSMIEDMKGRYSSDTEPRTCECITKARSNHCPAFAYLHPNVPDYGVHDIVRIGLSKKKLTDLVDDGIYELEEVPEDFELTEYQRNHVDVEQSKIPLISHQEICKALDRVTYPLYYLDYETFPTAVPVYDGCGPYQQVPFQFSLHVQEEPHGALAHYEYLHTDTTTHPMIALAEHLLEHIGPEGSIVVWNKKFEGKCHDDLAELLPEYAKTLHGYNQRFFDLMEIFSKQHYLHHDFRGGFSIKDVLPVLVPELSYKELNVRDGSMAMTAWRTMMFEVVDIDGREKLKQDLLKYCELDTLAMVRIFEELKKLSKI